MTSIIARHVTTTITRNASLCIGSVVRRSHHLKYTGGNLFRISTSNLYTGSLLDSARLQSKSVCTCNSLCRSGMCTAKSDYIATDVTLDEVVNGVLKHKMLLIDVRRPDELVVTGSIGRAVNIPLDEFEKAFSLSNMEFKQQYNTEKPSTDSDNIVIYCRSGKRALDACETLNTKGYRKVKRYPGSMNEWEETLLGSTAADRQAAIP